MMNVSNGVFLDIFISKKFTQKKNYDLKFVQHKLLTFKIFKILVSL